MLINKIEQQTKEKNEPALVDKNRGGYTFCREGDDNLSVSAGVTSEDTFASVGCVVGDFELAGAVVVVATCFVGVACLVVSPETFLYCSRAS